MQVNKELHFPTVLPRVEKKKPAPTHTSDWVDPTFRLEDVGGKTEVPAYGTGDHLNFPLTSPLLGRNISCGCNLQHWYKSYAVKPNCGFKLRMRHAVPTVSHRASSKTPPDVYG